MKAMEFSLLVLAGAISAGCTTERATMSADKPGSPKNSPKNSPRNWQRIAVIGHSFTDGNTWPYLVRQAITDAGRPEPILINAAGGGDVASDDLRRLDWAVLQYEPDLAIIMATARNVKKMTNEEFRAAMDEMIRKLQARGATVLLLYGHMRCPAGMEPADMANADKVREVVRKEIERIAAEERRPDSQKHGEEQIHRDLAAKYNSPIADMKPYMVKSFEQGNWQWEPDRGHLSFQGYRAVARAALDALGHQRIPVPQKLKVKVLPGLVTPIRIRAARKGEAVLDERTVLEVKPDDTWVTYRLPEKDPLDSWWPDQVRQEGYAMSVEKVVGKASRYIGFATITSAKRATACVNTSGGLQSVWLNGKRIFKSAEWNGFHAGAERIPVEMRVGENTLIFESGPQFALNVTPSALW